MAHAGGSRKQPSPLPTSRTQASPRRGTWGSGYRASGEDATRDPRPGGGGRARGQLQTPPTPAHPALYRLPVVQQVLLEAQLPLQVLDDGILRALDLLVRGDAGSSAGLLGKSPVGKHTARSGSGSGSGPGPGTHHHPPPTRPGPAPPTLTAMPVPLGVGPVTLTGTGPQRKSVHPGRTRRAEMRAKAGELATNTWHCLYPDLGFHRVRSVTLRKLPSTCHKQV